MQQTRAYFCGCLDCCKTGSSRDDDLDLNLNDLNLECLDETVGDHSMSGRVLGASANFSPSGVLRFSAFSLNAMSAPFWIKIFFIIIQRAEMRMVRRMCNVKVKNKVPSEELRERLGRDDIILVLQQSRLL